MAVSMFVAVSWRLFERRRLREPGAIVWTLARDADPGRAARALRALTLLGSGAKLGGGVLPDGTSDELAHLHIARALAVLPSARIVERASHRASRLSRLALAFGGGALAVGVAYFWSVLEGGDVLVSAGGVAPLAMRWLGDVDLSVRPPDYLHEGEHREGAFSPLMLPYGTLVTVRGAPLRPGRSLFLSDGTSDIPFVDDGAGAVVARWPLVHTATLHVVARFGAVAIPEPEALALRSIPDLRPVVSLEGAPRQVRLAELAEDSIPVRYEAVDDHGLREVHLVLRSGTREERRVLARLDGETNSNQGGNVLTLRDPFLRRSHVPIEITVEAKDNDPLTGPKWGASPAITLIPPEVGEPEARRLNALRAVRDGLVDSLAWRLGNEPPAAKSARTTFIAGERRRATDDENRLDEVLGQTYAGVRVPGRLRAMVVAQKQKMHKAIDAEVRSFTAPTHTAAVAATERFALVVDAVIRGLGVHDTREASKQLADVADDLALGAGQLQEEGAEARSRGAARMDASNVVLAGGGRVMKELGALGRDIGEIVEADLLRVKRARDGADFLHAELAARDLAARLRQPDPSFGSQGHMGQAGGESGGGHGTPGEEGGDSGDEVDRAQQEAEQDLERLAQDHAGEISKIEQALNGATSDAELKTRRDEAQRHANAIREAARDLPSVGTGSDSWTSKGAAARELAEQMAHALEQAHPDDAVQSGRSALGSLDEAKKMLQRGGWLQSPGGDSQKRVDQTRQRLEAEEKWAEQELRDMRKQAAERARQQLEQGGEEEDKMSERARDLGQKSHDSDSLPEQAVESIRDAERAARQAAQALKQGDADTGLERQREAQRDLEAARQQLEGDSEAREPQAEDGDSSKPSRAPVAIPNAKEHKGPEEFRRRVVRGLGQPASGTLKDAVRRYAEGLLR